MTWLFHLQSLPGREWIDRDVPLQGAQVAESISGPAAISGYILPGYVHREALNEWGALLVAEQDGRPPVAAIIDSVTTDGARLKVEAGGFSMYPNGMPWTDPDYSSSWIDPLVVFRMIWATLQDKPGGNLGVVVDTTTSSVRLGVPENQKLTAAKARVTAATKAEAAAKANYTSAAKNKETARVALLAAAARPASGVFINQDTAPSGDRRSTKNLWMDKNDANKGYIWNGKKWVLQAVTSQATLNSRLSDYNAATGPVDAAKQTWTLRKQELAAAKKAKSDISGGEAQPYTLTWWETHDLGSVIDDLVKNTPFDYREVSAWDGEDITHRLELGVPMLGGRRPDLRFEVGVNVKAPPPLQERDYASEVTVLGSGEGRAMVRATITGNPGRLRRATVVQRKDITKSTAAATAARAEVGKRSAAWVFNSLDVIDHELAPYGSFRPGDIVYVTGDAGWAQLDDWVRVLQINTDCVTGDINMKVGAP